MRSRIAAALALAVVVAILPMMRPSTAIAADAEASINVVIDQLTPVVAKADGTLTIRGRVVSTARTQITGVAVQLRRSSEPLSSRRELEAVVGSGMVAEDGDPDAVAVPQARVEVSPMLPPGGRASFTIKIPFADLGLPTAGTYALSVEALGSVAGAQSERKGITRTFLPWFPSRDSVRPVSTVWLWPLADWPSRSSSGVLLNNRTPLELSEGGRLDRLLNVGNRFRSVVSWIADPALLQTASDMAEGYQVVIDSQVAVGEHEQDARRWLTTLGAATSDTALRTLPYADIDASAVVRAGMSNDVVRAVTTGPTVASMALGHSAPGGLYWAPFGRIDRATANVLASAGVTTMVLSADAVPPTDDQVTTDGEATASLPTSSGAIRAVLVEPGLSAVLAMPQRTPSDVVLARQRFLAESALIATSIPADSEQRTIVVAPTDPRWDPASSLVAPLLRATRNAPWLRPATLEGTLSERPSSTSRDRGGYGDRAKQAELSPGYMQAVARVTDKLGSFTSIIDDPTGVSEPYSTALLRAESAAWRTDLPGGRRLVTSIGDELTDQMSLVRVLTSGNVTFSGDSGRVPVTIGNDLDRAVTVGVELVGRPDLRLESEPLNGIRIDAGRMASVDIDARVIGGDPLEVDVQLLDADHASYGRPSQITLASTAYARAAAWVVGIAFVAILVFVVVGVTRRIRKAHASRGGPEVQG